jgi:hypothetical protein
MSRSSKKFIFSICLVVAVVIALPIAAYLRPKSNTLPACKLNLEQIEICKQHWEGDQTNKNTNAVPSWDDLHPYFPASWSNRIPVCPDGGTYTVGRVGELPKCSIGGYRHSISEW